VRHVKIFKSRVSMLEKQVSLLFLFFPYSFTPVFPLICSFLTPSSPSPPLLQTFVMSNRNAIFPAPYRLPVVRPPGLDATLANPLRLLTTPPIGGGALDRASNDVEGMVLADIRPVHLPNLAIPPAHVVVSFVYAIDILYLRS
jgi:hypothetical protein